MNEQITRPKPTERISMYPATKKITTTISQFYGWRKK